eukprot:Plantae.Rhodophyta-Purpureofilum_apyrenoidigerum.ctg1706.p1 GENE.Plantae.Rhodophyta-Purpureofilum_apyrenoidigerum.ctg1706~~Plantae.Rhodophyta-Purpureofilum_apyrenoidigerum.ctg1706.p1  ORF type:complete len:217 (-),score=46.01 Plantae.Rhodophyta-Purpureofilum_apyrenoidigerum.ctg1706:74-724(-)
MAFVGDIAAVRRQARSGSRNRCAVKAQITFYRGANNRSRAAPVDWLLAELNAESEVKKVKLDMQEEQHKNPEENPHPFQKVPCLKLDDGTVVFESAQLIMYLARRFDNLKLTDSQIAEMDSWIVWVNASFGPAIVNEKTRPAGFEFLKTVDKILASRQFLCAFDKFCAADVAVVYLLTAIKRFISFPDDLDTPNLDAYIQRITAREAYKQTILAQA